jgi:hypothetical protein
MTSKIAAYGAKKILGPELTKFANKKVAGDYVSCIIKINSYLG